MTYYAPRLTNCTQCLGIGLRTVEQITTAARRATEQVAWDTKVRLDVDGASPARHSCWLPSPPSGGLFISRKEE